MEKGTELGTFGGRHFAEIQQMPPSLDDNRSCAELLQRGVLDEEVLTSDDVATWDGGVQELGPRFQAILMAAGCGSPIGENTEAGRSPQSLRCLWGSRGMWTSISVLSCAGGQRRKSYVCRTLKVEICVDLADHTILQTGDRLLRAKGNAKGWRVVGRERQTVPPSSAS